MRIKITKTKVGRSHPEIADVRLNVNSGGDKRKAVVCTFYNNSYKRVTTTEFVSPSINTELTKLYFETGNSKEGFKLSTTGSNLDNRKIRFYIDDDVIWKNKTGYFNLIYDSVEKLYYINLNNEISKER